jgi:hypothetical protein
VWRMRSWGTEGVALTRGEIREGHLVGAAGSGVEVVNLPGKAIRRKPLDHCVWIEECPIHSLRRRTEYSVKPDGTCRHDHFSFHP